MTSILEVKDVDVTFRPSGLPATRAVIGASLALRQGTSLALVGESGSGKTTLARAVLGLIPRDSGEIKVFGDALPKNPREVPLAMRRRMQPLFQDPGASLDPMWRVGDLLMEAMEVTGSVEQAQYDAEISIWMNALGLDRDLLTRRAHELSGGQKQRMALARALVTGAKLLVLDEPLTALDPPAQRAASELLLNLKRAHGISSLLVSHDIGLVRFLADDVAVMYRGRIVESGCTEDVLAKPKHPYTSLLLASVLPTQPLAARGRLASLPEDHVTEQPLAGCAFAPRCLHAIAKCHIDTPSLSAVPSGAGHAVACPVVV